MSLTDRAIKFENSNAIQDNVITQKFKESINSLPFYDITFTGVGGVSIPNRIDNNYKLKNKSFNYIYGSNEYIVQARCIYEKDDIDFYNEILDFSSATPDADAYSNYFLYYDLNDALSSFSLPEWKVYTNQKKINLSSIANELKNKGGFFVNFKNKSIEEFNITSSSQQTIDLNSSDILNNPNLNIKTKSDNQEVEVYKISKNEDNDNNEFLFDINIVRFDEETTIEDPDDAINPPDDILILNDLSLNFDISGRTKVKKTITKINKQVTKEITEVYGFVFTALDVSKKIEVYDPNLDEIKIYYKLEEKTPNSYWKKIERRVKKYTFGKYGYITKIDTDGWRLGRYRKEQGVPFNTDKIGDIPTIKWNPDANSIGNEYKKGVFEFKKFQIKELTQRKLEPHAYYYKDVEGRKLEDIIIFYKKYNNFSQEVDQLWTRDKNWYEPMFVSQEYYFSSIYGETYDYYKLPNGDFKLKEEDLISPDVFGEIKEYYKDITIFTNKQDVSNIGTDFTSNIIEPNEENYYKIINKTFQVGNSGFSDIAKKTEISTNSGLPPVGERIVTKRYIYNIKDTTEPTINIPDGYFQYPTHQKITVYPTEVDNFDEPSPTFIKPNNYKFAKSKNIQQALQTNVGTIQTDKNFEIGNEVDIDNFPKLFVLSKTKVVDTQDKVGGIFPDGSIRTNEYYEYELGVYIEYFSEKYETVFDDDNNNNSINIQLPSIKSSGIGYSRSSTRSKIKQLSYATRANEENNEEFPINTN